MTTRRRCSRPSWTDAPWCQHLWFLEVANLTSLSEQKGVLKTAERVKFMALLAGLRKQVDYASGERIWGEVQELSRKRELTSHDARYLELAKRMNLPLASTDRDLPAATKKARVVRFDEKR